MNRKFFYRLLLVAAVVGLFVFFAFPLDKRINLGLDLKGGMHLLFKVDTQGLSEDARADAVERAKENIRDAIDRLGVREPIVQKQGLDELVVQLPGVTNRQGVLDVITTVGYLEFKIVSDDSQKLQDALNGNIPEGYELKYSQENKEPLLLEKKNVLTGESLKSASIDFGEYSQPRVDLEFNAEGAKRFAEITRNNIGKRLAILLDGKVQSAPMIREEIPSGKANITGRFTQEQAQSLSLILRRGALPAPVVLEEERTVGPSLGQDSISKGILSTVIGGLLVLVFMAGYYLLAGLIADVALVLNLVMILGGLGMLPHLFGVSATLTLPGIAGIALSLGMAVDANVLINERIREELNTGKTMRQAITNGYNRAFSAILDSNITTLIAAFLLFCFGTGPIKGFAVTLTIGLIASMFTAIIVTRAIFELLLEFGLLKSLPMLRLFKETHLDFIGKRKICYAISIVIVTVGLVVFFEKGKNAYGIDFSGGQLQEYSFKNAPSVDAVREAMKEINLADATIQQFKENPRVVLIKTGVTQGDVITDKLKERFPQDDIQVLRVEKVGPVAGNKLRSKASGAIIWSLIGILIYVSIRFKHFNFAVAGVVAILHDVLVTLGALAITGRPIDLLSVTAFLTIAGYSINDTIVIYDRVRENSRLQHRMSLAELINLSVNQTLGRTILTSTVTLLVVIAILFYGGEVLSNFAFALLVGFISGVYSTVYIASPLVLAWERRKKVRT
ncbi:MAG: protein translocase subunit SecD [Candidatus Omnitrophota bacterium]